MKYRRMPLLWVVCAPFVIVAVASLLMLQHTERKVFGVLIDSGGQLLLKMHNQHLASEMGRFLEAPFLAQAYLGHLIGITGLGEQEDLQLLQPFMRNVLRNTNIAHLSSVSMIQFGSAEGSYIGLEQDAARSAGRVLSSKFSRKELTEADSGSGESRVIAQGFDPRTRPWYDAGAKSKTSAWAPVYDVAVYGKQTLTAVSPVFSDREQRLLGVVGADLSLGQLQALLKQAAFHRNFDSSVSFVLDHDNRTIVDTSETVIAVKFGDPAAEKGRSLKSGTSASALVRAGIVAAAQAARSGNSHSGDGSFGFSLVHEGQQFMGWAT